MATVSETPARIMFLTAVRLRSWNSPGNPALSQAVAQADSRVILRALSETIAQVKSHKGPVTPLVSLPVPVALQGPGVPKSTGKVGLFGAPDVPTTDKFSAKSETTWDPFK